MNGEMMIKWGSDEWMVRSWDLVGQFHGDIMGEISKTSTQGGMDHQQRKLGENHG